MTAKLVWLPLILSLIPFSMCLDKRLCALQECQCTNQRVTCHHMSEPLMVSPSTLDSDVVELELSKCSSVVLATAILSHARGLKVISVNESQSVVLQSRLSGQTEHTMDTLLLYKIESLEVERQALEGVSLLTRLHLESVSMSRVASLAFNPTFVHNEANLIASTFNRVSLWGFKFNAKELNVLGKCVFQSLASRAFEVRSQKLMMAFNEFRALHDSAFDIEYQLADIQGNTFRVMTGKPFFDLRPARTAIEGEESVGLIFRENNFGSESTRLFAALAMPHFKMFNDAIETNKEVYVDVEQNNFVCECKPLLWFLRINSLEAESNVNQLDPSGGSLAFMRKLYDTANLCLICDNGNDHCHLDTRHFKEFAKEALDDTQQKCQTGTRNQVALDEEEAETEEDMSDDDEMTDMGVTSGVCTIKGSIDTILALSSLVVATAITMSSPQR